MARPKTTGLLDKSVIRTATEWQRFYPELEIPPRVNPQQELTGADVEQLLAYQKEQKQSAVDKARGEGIAQENKLRLGKTTIYDPRDPSKVLGDAKDEKAAEVLDEVLGPSAQAVEVINKIIRIAEESGGNADIAKNADWQAIMANQGYLDNLVRVSERMGTLDAGAAAAIQKMRGGVNPNSFIYDAAPGLRAMRDNIVTKARLTAGRAGIDPASIDHLYVDPGTGAKAKKDPLGARIMERPIPRNVHQAQGIEDPPHDVAALDIVETNITRHGDAAAAATLAEAAASAPNRAAARDAAARLWKLRQAGDPRAVEAFRNLGRNKQAATLVNLPPDLARYAFERPWLSDSDQTNDGLTRSD
jgi:hypothetical protein